MSIPYEERKPAIRAELERLARARTIITYAELATIVGISSQGPWKPVLDLIGEEEQQAGRPDVACLAVSWRTGFSSYVGASHVDRHAAMALREQVFDLYKAD